MVLTTAAAISVVVPGSTKLGQGMMKRNTYPSSYQHPDVLPQEDGCRKPTHIQTDMWHIKTNTHTYTVNMSVDRTCHSADF